jgi:oligopeptide/dipeptide ABC transporter ATP-binding protein
VTATPELDRLQADWDESETLLDVDQAVKHFPVKGGALVARTIAQVRAVDGVSFDLKRGETLGLVGESGCGKSTLARLITALHPVTSGHIRFKGQDITTLNRRQMRPLRRSMQMVFQDPYGSLNPRMRVGSILGEAFAVHGVASGDDRKRRVQDLMQVVGLSPEHYNRFPAEFSGGQRQRIGIARALALRPELIVCDEPVSALDVSIQAQILNLLEDLQQDFGLTYIFIAHDLSVVRHVSNRLAVMYLGKLAEIGPVEEIYGRARHPYTASLLSAVPIPETVILDKRRERVILSGDVPSPVNPPSGCRFHPRCPKAQEICRVQEPPLETKPGDSANHRAACHFPVQPGELLANAAWEEALVEPAGRDASATDPSPGRQP